MCASTVRGLGCVLGLARPAVCEACEGTCLMCPWQDGFFRSRLSAPAPRVTFCWTPCYCIHTQLWDGTKCAAQVLCPAGNTPYRSHLSFWAVRFWGQKRRLTTVSLKNVPSNRSVLMPKRSLLMPKLSFRWHLKLIGMFQRVCWVRSVVFPVRCVLCDTKGMAPSLKLLQHEWL